MIDIDGMLKYSMKNRGAFQHFAKRGAFTGMAGEGFRSGTHRKLLRLS